MAKTKGTGAIALRKLLKKRGEDFYQTFLSKLPPAYREIYQRVLAVSWVPLTPESEDIQTAAQLLFPGDSKQIEKLGILLSEDMFNSVYKLFLKIPSLHFILKRIANVWRTNFDTGDMSLENSQPKSADLVLKQFPDFSPTMRQLFIGDIIGVGNLTHVKNVKVTLDESDPHAWRWHMEWD